MSARQPSRMHITFETEETVVLREGANVSVDHCARCLRDVLMATPQAAAFLSGTGEREIFRLIEAGLVHFTENGRVLICLESLTELAEENVKRARVPQICACEVFAVHVLRGLLRVLPPRIDEVPVEHACELASAQAAK